MCAIDKDYVIVTCTDASEYEGVVCWTDWTYYGNS